MALSYLGKPKTINKFMRRIFEIGREIDMVMKEQAEERWDDYSAPVPSLAVISNGTTSAIVKFTPDGLRPDEVVEFKGLSPTNYNLARTPEDFTGPNASPLFKKYGMQVEMYAGFTEKKWIRFILKNKRNMKDKEIRYEANPETFRDIKRKILAVKKILDDGSFPSEACSGKQKKYCMYKESCSQVIAERFKEQREKRLSRKTLEHLRTLSRKYDGIGVKIRKLESDKGKLSIELKGIMREHGQREVGDDSMMVKYGVRYRQNKNKDDIDKLVARGMISVVEAPEEYLSVSIERG